MTIAITPLSSKNKQNTTKTVSHIWNNKKKKKDFSQKISAIPWNSHTLIKTYWLTFPFHASRFRYKEKFWFTKSCEKDPNNLVYNRILYSVPFLLTSQYLGTIPWPLVFFKSLRIAFSKMILTTLKIFGSTLQCQKKLTQTERIQILFSSHFCIRNFNKVCN